ncbi:C6 zinc finger domain protein [Aspergillus ambiguus]|uniref:Zn(II)2Cys6 transcription factor n=1 Tax=Aspergillus ambiguus TaxID=176160 RepID=UPI003CCD557F
MPAGRRSRGCLLCVQRRVKCDERLPGCARCDTYGRVCPGYDRGFKFVAGKPYRTPRRPKDVQALSPITQAQSLALAQSGPLSLESSDLNMTQCLEILIDELSWPYSASSAYAITRWLRFLPGAYGRNRTLDATVRCFVAHHVGNMTQDSQAMRYARSAYVEALCGLQKALVNPVEAASPEVLCAVLLQCMYELFANSQDSISWMKHAKGLGQLIKFRGPQRYRSAFESNLLKASRGLVVMHSVFSGEECFLASEDWHAVMKQQFDHVIPSEIQDVVEDLFVSFTAIPRLIHEMFSLRTADMSDPVTQLRISNVVAEGLARRSDLEAWYERFTELVPPPREVPSSSGDPLYPTTFCFSSPDMASIFCAYYAYRIVVHELLRTCGFGYSGSQEAYVAYFCDQICKSVEYNSRGLLGPSRMGFPLRVAYEVGDSATKTWIEGQLHQLSKRYGALTPRNFKQ